MARIHTTLATAAVLGLATLGAAQAQMAQSQTGYAPAPAAPMPPSASAPMGAPMAPPVPMTPGMPHHRAMPGHAPGAPHASGTAPGAASDMTPGMAPSPMGAAGRPNVMSAPQQPFSGLSLPSQQVGNGAYNGGGVVLEYMPDGTTRVVR
jgi:hypothetical protein